MVCSRSGTSVSPDGVRQRCHGCHPTPPRPRRQPLAASGSASANPLSASGRVQVASPTDMSATLKATDLAAGHGARALFSGLDLVVGAGDVVGLVGANGAGKSTLLRLLAGEVEPEEGSVTLTPAERHGRAPAPGARAPGGRDRGRLPRASHRGEPRRDGDERRRRSPRRRQRPEPTTGMPRRWRRGWRWVGRTSRSAPPRRSPRSASESTSTTPMTALSGGQAARAGLAALLLSRYDVLLLDEPTNDLDLDGLERLEQFVGGLRSPAVIISHDREFLARTVTRVVELDLAQQQVAVYEGGYDSYLAEREVARRHAREAYEEFADTKERLEQRAVTQRNWATVGVKNARRKKTDNDKFVTAFRVDSSEKQAAKARQTERMIERLEVVEEPRKEWELRMTIAAAPRSGSVVASARGRGRAPRRLHPRARSTCRWTGPTGSSSPAPTARARPRCSACCSAPSPSTRGPPGSGRRCGSARWTRRAGCSSARRPLARAFGDALPDWPDAEVRTLLAKFGLGAEHVHRAGRLAVPRRAHPRRAGPAAGPRGQPARPRRAHQPPRPASHRTARAGPRLVRRHRPARHPRPPDAR